MILDRFRLDGRVAIVTGAGLGIGRGIAIGLAEAGADVVLAARTESDLEEVAGIVRALDRRALVVPTDVTEEAALVHLVDATLAEFGRLDICVNNAGGAMPRAAMDTSEGFLERTFHFNVTAPFTLTKLAARAMVDTAGAGSVVNISSRSASMTQTMFTAYGTAKAALDRLTRNMAPELAPRVRLNAIDVGGVATRSLEIVLTDDALREQFLAGDFSGPAQLHGPDMPGLASLRQAPRGRLRIAYHDLPEGAMLRYSSPDPALVDALHRWFRAQLDDHGDDAMEGHALQHGLHHHHLGMQGRDAAKEVP